MPYSFDLVFEVSGIHGYVMMDGHMPSLTQITCTFWMRSSDTVNYGTPISYAVEGSDNAFLLIDYNGWELFKSCKICITKLNMITFYDLFNSFTLCKLILPTPYSCLSVTLIFLHSPLFLFPFVSLLLSGGSCMLMARSGSLTAQQ